MAEWSAKSSVRNVNVDVNLIASCLIDLLLRVEQGGVVMMMLCGLNYPKLSMDFVVTFSICVFMWCWFVFYCFLFICSILFSLLHLAK
jgi:hypothetical protein